MSSTMYNYSALHCSYITEKKKKKFSLLHHIYYSLSGYTSPGSIFFLSFFL